MTHCSEEVDMSRSALIDGRATPDHRDVERVEEERAAEDEEEPPGARAEAGGGGRPGKGGDGHGRGSFG